MHARSARLWPVVMLMLGVTLLLTQGAVVPLRAAPASAAHPGANASPAQRAAIASSYGHLPLSFEANVGQDADPAVRFVAHGGGYALALTPGEVLLALSRTSLPPALPRDRFALPGQPDPMPAPNAPPSVLDMAWLGANPHSLVTGEQPLPGTVNYFIGNDPKQWHTQIATYQQVRIRDVYPGVDVVLYGTAGQLEYDFVVAPGGDPSRIALGMIGASGARVDLQGNLLVALPSGALQQDKPHIYQTVNGVQRAIVGGYRLGGLSRVGFALGVYNPRLPLVIDPLLHLWTALSSTGGDPLSRLFYSTYLGGSHYDEGDGIAVDASGAAYVAGSTSSTDFPVTPGVVQSMGTGDDAFVSKFNPAGTALVYSTFLGGGYAQAQAIAVDAAGNAYVTGYTLSTSFPTVNPVQATFGGGTADAFLAKLNPTGSALLFATYLGGNGDDYGYGVAVDTSGNAVVGGQTRSTNFPTANAAQGTCGGVCGSSSSDAFVTRINTAAHAYVYSTYLGGSGSELGTAVATDASGNAYVTGFTSSTDFPTVAPLQSTNHGLYDDFVTKYSAAGAVVYATYLGGSFDDTAHGIAVDTSGSAYIAGYTVSNDFPVINNLQGNANAGSTDVTVSKLNPTGSALVYSTYLGGSGSDSARGIAVDGASNAYIVGDTDSTDFPITANAVQSTCNSCASGYGDLFVAKLNASDSALLFSTYLGGGNVDVANGVAVGMSGNAYITGFSASTNFPTRNAIQPSCVDCATGGNDAIIAKMYTRPTPFTTLGVFRPSNGTLYLKNSDTTGPADSALAYGAPGDLPVTGDWIGQGFNTIGVYRNGTFYLRNSNTTGFADEVIPFGQAGDLPVAGDWTGKGYDSIGVYRPSNNTYYLRNTNLPGPADIAVTFGISGDVPIMGDWTSKGWDSVGIFRPSNGNVYLRNSNTTGNADTVFTYGVAGDKPVVGDWAASWLETIGVDRSGNFYLRESNTTGPADISFTLGMSGDIPIAGPWVLPPGSVPPPHSGTRVTRQPAVLPRRMIARPRVQPGLSLVRAVAA